MKFVIKNWRTDSVMFEVEADSFVKAVESKRAYLQRADLRGADLQRADLQGADLQGAYLQGAYLQGAYLQGAYLRGAYLQGAYLQGADLQGADLQGAYLQGADLRGAYGINAFLSTSLLMLFDQPGKIRAYKLVNADSVGPYQGGIKYVIGSTVEVLKANTDPTEQCASGINVADLPWCMKEWKQGYKILLVEFEAKDIACIPTATDGKFRLFRCDVVGEKDLTEIGLIEKKEVKP